MITITKGQLNTVDLSLYQKTSEQTPYFLFVFSNLGKVGQIKVCTSTANVGFWGRYARFEITEKTNPTLTNSQIELQPGLYNYKIYSKGVNNTTIPTDDPIETGMARITGNSSTINKYEPTTTTIAYDPNN